MRRAVFGNAISGEARLIDGKDAFCHNKTGGFPPETTVGCLSMTRYDKILITALLLCGAVALLGVRLLTAGRGGGMVVLQRGSEIVETRQFLSAGKNEILTITGPLGDSRVELAGDKVRMLASPCPDKTCVRMGWIGTTGQTVVCIPNQVVITITGEKGGFDAVSY
jgi:hypothetical protein